MGITSGIVLFAVIWFLVLFVSLPIRLKTQGDVGEVTPGTHAGAPAELNLRRKLLIVTAITVVLWAVIAWAIVSGVVTVRDLDIFNRMDPVATTQG